MQISTKLRERKDHFVIAFYKNERKKKFDVFIRDIIVFKLNNYELIKPIRKDFHTSLPKKFIDGFKNHKFNL